MKLSLSLVLLLATACSPSEGQKNSSEDAKEASEAKAQGEEPKQTEEETKDVDDEAETDEKDKPDPLKPLEGASVLYKHDGSEITANFLNTMNCFVNQTGWHASYGKACEDAGHTAHNSACMGFLCSAKLDQTFPSEQKP